MSLDKATRQRSELLDCPSYNPGQMSVKDCEVFLAWHKGKIESGAIFDFKWEMEEYCRSDVDILRKGCIVSDEN